MYKRFLAVVFGVTMSVVASSSSFAEKLIALSIGVSAYTNISPLSSTVNDAVAVANALAEFGYEVRLLRNPTSQTMRSAIDAFVNDARNADVAVMYFSGHGQQVNGESYMAPADAGGGSDPFADHLSVSAIVSRLEAAGVKTKIVFVDACRTNPHLDENGRPRTDRLINAGAGERRVLGAGAMLSFASAAGELSRDSNLAYSTYTQALLEVLRREERVELQQLTRMTRRLMLDRIAANLIARQTPFEISSVDAPVYFERTTGGQVREIGGGRQAAR